MALVVGNVALLIDPSSPRISLPDRKNRLSTLDLVSNFPKKLKDSILLINTSPTPTTCPSLDFDTTDSGRTPRITGFGRRRPNSKANAFDFGSSNGLGGDTNTTNNNSNNSNGDEDDGGNGTSNNDWEQEMRKRLKEIEEMKELEKKAEELQSEMADQDQGDDEETEEEKKNRVRRELEKLAKEQAERREMAKLMFDLGQKAYGKGMYGRAIEFLEAALTIIPRPTLFGGEIQIWLAMAYEANNRHSDCIALYQQLEKKHPSVSIRRQAANLRYILQAPKLKISEDEMVTIPLIGSSYDRYAGSWSDKYKDQDQPRSGVVTTNQLPSSRDYLGDFLVWRPPSGWEKNQVFWLALIFWLGLVSVAVFLQR
ncbi:uncharacterized protein LOC131246094 isoform X1 [Magnolia sinica]|uniref:uncharacterized protein LOC131246094 isoform X1 n=1 Tax=Magnolia sinica TaxID=86752 RepID=UPI002657BB53|nr:uncharacterized protein LOC131246094 isoform X1 [Magnolia sinica]XP_058101947.1 uncharacterized protein LOC131246094 isoform X1 [Magnolia sinica]